MSGERDLGRLLAGLDPRPDPVDWVFVAVPAVPEGTAPLMSFREAEALKDQYVSTEHLLLALIEAKTAAGEILKRHGVTRDRLLQVLPGEVDQCRHREDRAPSTQQPDESPDDQADADREGRHRAAATVVRTINGGPGFCSASSRTARGGGGPGIAVRWGRGPGRSRTLSEGSDSRSSGRGSGA